MSTDTKNGRRPNKKSIKQMSGKGGGTVACQPLEMHLRGCGEGSIIAIELCVAKHADIIAVNRTVSDVRCIACQHVVVGWERPLGRVASGRVPGATRLGNDVRK